MANEVNIAADPKASVERMRGGDAKRLAHPGAFSGGAPAGVAACAPITAGT